MKKFPKAILSKIELINSLIDRVNDAGDIPYTYNGGTWPHEVLIKPIQVSNQFVTIINAGTKSLNGSTFINGKERFNVNKVTTFGDDNCREHLNYTLSIILKAFKKTLNHKQQDHEQ